MGVGFTPVKFSLNLLLLTYLRAIVHRNHIDRNSIYFDICRHGSQVSRQMMMMSWSVYSELMKTNLMHGE